MSKKGDMKELFNGIKQAFKNFKGEESEQKFGKSTIADGTVLQWEGDEPMPGAAIVAIGADGASAPAPDGEYVLPETGMTIKCEAGVITSVVPAASQETTNPAANQGMSDNQAQATQATAKEIVERVEKVSKFADEAEARFSAMEENIKNLSEALATAKKENDEYKMKMEKFSKQITETIEAYGEQPQEQDNTEQNFRDEEKTNKKEADEILSRLSFR